MPSLTRLCGAALVVLMAYHPPAHAYIDPGSGSLILQGLVALFVGAAFTLKTFFRERIKPVIDWLLRRPRAQPPAQPPADPDN